MAASRSGTPISTADRALTAASLMAWRSPRFRRCSLGEGLGVFLAELAPAARVLARALGQVLRHDVIRRPQRTGLAVAGFLDADLLHLDVVGREQVGIAGDGADRLARPGEVG